jgi:hypothetical protein
VSFIDDFSKYIWVYLIKQKSDVFQVFKNFQNLVERKFNKKIISMQTDWGGEYEKLNSFFQEIDIAHRVSCPHAHQQNGAAERKHRHIVEVGLALLANASMPLKFWDEAFLTAAYNLLIFCRVESSTIAPLLNFSFERNQIISLLEYLVVHVGQIFDPITPANLLSDLLDMFFLAIVLFIKVLSALNLLLVGFTSHVMWFLMRTFFLSASYILMLVLTYAKKFFYCHTSFKSRGCIT